MTACAYLAAVYLTADAVRAGDEGLATAFRRKALAAGIVVGAVALAGIFVLRADARPLYDGLTGRRGLPLVGLSALAGLGSMGLLYRRGYVLARLAAAGAVAAVLWGWAAGQYPYLLEGQLTIEQAAADRNVLQAILVALGVGGALVIPSLWALFAAAQRPAKGVAGGIETESVVPQGPPGPAEEQ